MATDPKMLEQMQAEAAKRLGMVARTGWSQGGRKVLEATAIELTNMLKIKLSQPGSGRVYKSRGGKAQHRASAPGEPPAPDLGEYRNSFRWKAGTDAKGAFAEIGTSQQRARALEFGTRHMKPRPHFRPVMAEAGGVIRKNVGTIGERQRTAAAKLRKDSGRG